MPDQPTIHTEIPGPICAGTVHQLADTEMDFLFESFGEECGIADLNKVPVTEALRNTVPDDELLPEDTVFDMAAWLNRVYEHDPFAQTIYKASVDIFRDMVGRDTGVKKANTITHDHELYVDIPVAVVNELRNLVTHDDLQAEARCRVYFNEDNDVDTWPDDVTEWSGDMVMALLECFIGDGRDSFYDVLYEDNTISDAFDKAMPKVVYEVMDELRNEKEGN